MKPTLYLPENWLRLICWNRTLCRMLAESGVFAVGIKTFPPVRCPAARKRHFHQMEVAGKMVGVDTWDTHRPLSDFVNRGCFEPAGACAHLDLVLKIQAQKDDLHWSSVARKIGVPIRPWTIFPSGEFPLGAFRWTDQRAFAYTASLSGKNDRFGRQPWADWARHQPDFQLRDHARPKENLHDYMAMLADCKWGVILHGRWDAYKNRRECEFTSCGMPLALNYVPSYEFEFEPGSHFFLLHRPEDLALLREVDPVPFAAASTQVYRDHFSPAGMAGHLLRMVKEL